MNPRPVICDDCGALYVQHENDDSCPVCADPPAHTIRIMEDEPRFLVMLELTRRWSLRRPPGMQLDRRQVKATVRERSMLNHGDEIYLHPFRWRIAAKAHDDIWLTRERELCRDAIRESGGEAVDRIPDRIPLHVLDILDFETARSSRILPISCSRRPGALGRPEVVALIPVDAEMDSRIEQVVTSEPDYDWIFWKALPGLVSSAIRDQYSRRDNVVENCGGGFEFECARRWEELSETDVADIRFCEGCQQRVVLTTNATEADLLREHGHCIAFHEFDSDWEGGSFTMGIPALER